MGLTPTDDPGSSERCPGVGYSILGSPPAKKQSSPLSALAQRKDRDKTIQCYMHLFLEVVGVAIAVFLAKTLFDWRESKRY